LSPDTILENPESLEEGVFQSALGGFRRRGEDLDLQIRNSLEYAFSSPMIDRCSFETKSRSGSAPGAAFGEDRVTGGRRRLYRWGWCEERSEE
jgi:hypothetical protein